MTNTAPATEDGHLPSALRHLGNAISKLIDPKPETLDNRIHWTDSLYDQLLDACPGDQGKSHSMHAGSIVPFWVDAVDLKQEIDTAVAAWEPRPNIDVSVEVPEPITITRLKAIEKRGWRPQDVKGLEQIAGNVVAWAESIMALLTPVPKWSLPNPCPACNTAIVYRRDGGGELVRSAALQIGPEGCHCLKCRTVWAPERFVFLSKVLGTLPEGVLE